MPQTADADDTPRTRDALLAAAASLIDAGGMTAVSLREVGRLVGVTQTTPYRHFTNKESLLAAVAEQFYHELASLLTLALRSGRGAKPRLRAVFHAYADYVLAHPERYRLMLGEGFRLKDHAGTYLAAGKAFEVLQRAVAAAASGGRDSGRQGERLALICYAACHGVLDLTLSGHLHPEKGVTPHSAFNVILRALCDGRSGLPRKQKKR